MTNSKNLTGFVARYDFLADLHLFQR